MIGLCFGGRGSVSETVTANPASDAPALHPTFPDGAARFGLFGDFEAVSAALDGKRPTNQTAEFGSDRDVAHRRDLARFTMEEAREHGLLAEGDLLIERFE